MKFSVVALFLAAIALQTYSTSAHLCVLSPVAQRGGYDVSTPANMACFKKQGPCGDQPMEDPHQTFTAGEKVEWTFQQNLNHYSIGSGGKFDFAYTTKLDNPTDADFITIGEIADYAAYHQWTQTNVTLAIPTPNVDCEHCIMRFRYLPNKPTEPVFHQCVDIAIEKDQYDTHSDNHVDSVTSVTIIDDEEEEVVSTSSNGFPLAAFSAEPLEIGYGPANQVLADPWSGEVKTVRTLSSSHGIEDAVVTVDRANKYLYVYDSTYTPGHDQHSIVRLDSDGKTEEVRVVLKDLPFALSDIHYDHKLNRIVGVGLTASKDANPDWSLKMVTINPQTGEWANVNQGPKLDAYVDFVWSAYDAEQGVVYALLRHEDEPLTLQAQLHTLGGRDSNGQLIHRELQLDTTFLISSFIVESQSHNTILALTPGNPNVAEGTADAKWQLVSIDTITGAMESVMDAPQEVNDITNKNGGVYWGGAVAGFDNSKYNPSPDGISLHMIGYGARTPHPAHFKALAINLKEMEITVLDDLPYLHNMVLVG